MLHCLCLFAEKEKGREREGERDVLTSTWVWWPGRTQWLSSGSYKGPQDCSLLCPVGQSA